jgi:hypothetical protein
LSRLPREDAIRLAGIEVAARRIATYAAGGKALFLESTMA